MSTLVLSLLYLATSIAVAVSSYKVRAEQRRLDGAIADLCNTVGRVSDTLDGLSKQLRASPGYVPNVPGPVSLPSPSSRIPRHLLDRAANARSAARRKAFVDAVGDTSALQADAEQIRRLLGMINPKSEPVTPREEMVTGLLDLQKDLEP